MAPAVAKKVNGTVITSSPAFTPDTIKARRSASLPDAQPIAWRLPTYCAMALSKSATRGPRTNPCSSQTASMTASTSALMLRYWAFRSNNGTFTMTPVAKVVLQDWAPASLAVTKAYHTDIDIV